MAEYASKGREHAVRTQARGPEPARAKSPEELAQETKRRAAAAEQVLRQTRTAIDEAKKAFGERDVESFEDAKRRGQARLTQARVGLLSLREHVSEVESPEAGGQLAQLDENAKVAKKDLEALVAPEPLPEPFTNEELILSAIPSGRVDNAHVAFAAAEARLIGLLAALPRKDRGIFLTRIGKEDALDPVATRWRRLGADRRDRILAAMRSARAPQKNDEAVAPEASADVGDGTLKHLKGVWRDLNAPQVEEEPVEVSLIEATYVSADEWLAMNQFKLAERLRRLVGSSIVGLANARLSWGQPAFGGQLAAELIVDAPLDNLRYVLPQTDLAALANRLRILAEPAAEKGDEKLSADNRDGDDAGPVGPPTWEPDVAIEIARSIDVQVRVSVARLEPRVAAAIDANWQDDRIEQPAFDPSAIVRSHPIDWFVAKALSSRGTLSVSRAEKGADAEPKVEVRPVQFRWLDERAMWNWIETSPADASAEEVSKALFGTTEKAYLLRASAPFFEVPVKEATELAPERRLAIEARNLLSGPAQGDAGSVGALVSSSVAETAALAQASRSAKANEKDPAAINGVRVAAACRLDLEILAEKLPALGVHANLGAVMARLEGRTAALATVDAGQSAQMAVLFEQQQSLLFRVGTLLGKLGRAPLSPPAMALAAGLAEVAGISDFAESARARLAEFASQAGALPSDIASATLDQAMARFGGVEALLKATDTPIVLFEERVDFSELRSDYDRLRERALDVERRAAVGLLDPKWQRDLQNDIEDFELKVRTIHQVTQLTKTMEAVSGVYGWDTEIVAIGDDLQDDHHALKKLRDDIVRRYRAFSQERSQYLRGLAAPNRQLDPRTEYETTSEAVGKFKAELIRIGGDAKVRETIQHAYDTMDSADGRLALLEFGKFIGITLASAGVGSFVQGVARGFQVGRLAVAAATVTAEAAVTSTLTAVSGDQPFLETFATEMVTGMAFFGAFRAFESVWSASQVGRNVTSLKASGGVNKLAAAAVEFSAQGVFAMGLQTATAEAQSLIAKGRVLSSDEFAVMVAHGAAMHIGSTIAHKVATPALNRLEALGARGASLIVKARRVRALAKRVGKAGSLEESLELISAAQDLAQAEAKLHADEARGGRAPEDAPINNPGASQEIAASALETGIAYQDLALEAITAQSGLEQITGGLAGTTSEVAALVVKAEAAGLVHFQHIRADGSRIVTLEGDSRSIEIRELDRPDSPAERGESLETQIEVNRLLRDPPPIQRQLDEFLGVMKSPEDAKAQQELAGFFQSQDEQAKRTTRVISGRQADGPYRWRYSVDATPLDHGIVSVQYRVFLDVQGVAPSDIPAFQQRVHEGIDRYYNYQHEVRGPGGKPARLHLEVEFVDDPAAAHATVQLHPGDGGADAFKWFADDDPAVPAHEVGHAVGFRDEYVDASAPNRADSSAPGVKADETLMGDFWLVDANGAYARDPAGRPVPDPRAGLKQRHLDQLSALWGPQGVVDRVRELFRGDQRRDPNAPSGSGDDDLGASLRRRVSKENEVKPGRFELLLDRRDLDAIIANGRRLGLDDATIEDIIFIGSRTDKRRSAKQMMDEMQSSKVIDERGYPYRFKDMADFEEFKAMAATEIGRVVEGTVLLQGSSLRNPEARDLDVAVIVENGFDELLVRSFDGKVKLDDERVELRVETLEQLIVEIEQNGDGFNSSARTLQHAYRLRKARDKDVGLKPVRKALAARWGDIDLSVIEGGTGFDMRPMIELSKAGESDE